MRIPHEGIHPSQLSEAQLGDVNVRCVGSRIALPRLRSGSTLGCAGLVERGIGQQADPAHPQQCGRSAHEAHGEQPRASRGDVRANPGCCVGCVCVHTDMLGADGHRGQWLSRHRGILSGQQSHHDACDA